MYELMRGLGKGVRLKYIGNLYPFDAVSAPNLNRRNPLDPLGDRKPAN